MTDRDEKRPKVLTEHVMVRLPPELHQQMRAYADANEMTVAQVVRAAVKRYLATSDGGWPTGVFHLAPSDPRAIRP